jgi:hypothetical protein
MKATIPLLVALALLIPTAKADVLTDGYAFAAGFNTTTIEWSHETGTGNDTYLIVGISLTQESGPSSVSSITYGGSYLSLLRHDTFAGKRRSEIWGLLNPESGNHSVIVSLSANEHVVGGSVTFEGVNQSSPVYGKTGKTGYSSLASVEVSAAGGDMVFDTLSLNDYKVPSTGSGKTELWKLRTGGTNTIVYGGGSIMPGAADVEMSWILERES